MPLSVAEYAAEKRVHPSAVRRRVRDGEIPAAKVGSQWVIDESALNARKPSSRPMAPDNARQLIELISGLDPDFHDPKVKQRLHQKVASLRDGRAHADHLWSWVRSRAPRYGFSCAREDLNDLLADYRIIPSGIVDPRARLAVSDVVEGYVDPDELPLLIHEFLLVPSERANVWLHAAKVPVDDGGRIPVGFVIADLLDHGGPRESAEAERLIREVL